MPKHTIRSIRPQIGFDVPPPQSLGDQAQLFVPISESYFSGTNTFQDYQQKPNDSFRLRVTYLVFALVILIETGSLISTAPAIRICETIACQHYYAAQDPSKIDPNTTLPEAQCKIAVVQAEVALIKGWQDFFDGLIGAALAVPMGMYADAHGRRPALILVVPGFLGYGLWTLAVYGFPDTFPLKSLWLSSAFLLAGGGPTVLSAILWTMLADVIDENARATTFYRIGAAIMAAELVSASLSGFLMERNPWIAMLLGWGVVSVGLVLIFAFPETHPAKSNNGFMRLSTSEDEGDTSDVELSPLSRPLRSNSEAGLPRSTPRCTQSPLSEITRLIVSTPRLGLLLFTFSMFRLSRGAIAFMLQYVSMRYSWPISRVTFLFSLRAAINIALFVIVLPAVSHLLFKKLRRDEAAKDLLLAQISIAFLAVGSVGIAFSGTIAILILNLIIYTTGSGFAFLIRSLVTSMVPPGHVAKLYTGVTIFEAVGGFLSSPLSAWFFRIGLSLGGEWIGLPFVATGCLFVATGMIVWCMRLPDTC